MNDSLGEALPESFEPESDDAGEASRMPARPGERLRAGPGYREAGEANARTDEAGGAPEPADAADEAGEVVPTAGLAVEPAGPPGPLPPGRRGLRARLAAALRTKRGLFITFVLVAGIGSAMTVGSVAAIQWTETADFCGRCHTMGPELKAYEMSPHREVACAECHVEPGVAGWIKGKVNGTKQLVQIITSTFPKPIPAPDHADLPSVTTSCEKCHDVNTLLANGGPVNLVLHNRYADDEANTKTTVALVVRPVGFGGSGAIKGVHWHIGEDVEYFSSDPRAQTIDMVQVNHPGGQSETFIAAKGVTLTEAVQPDIDHLVGADRRHRMDCIDCHNRIGHGIPSLAQAIDAGIDGGGISPSLPYVKKEAVDRLSIQYASEADGEAAIDGLRDFYRTRYPVVASSQDAAITKAIDDLKRIYRLVATPGMQVNAETYPNNLGHQSSPGCFRCHDGAHYRVVDGAVTKETIPSACTTCHTFPQIGGQESGVLIGQRPSSHDDKLWVFDHKTAVATVDPTKATCGACHTQTYCQNCHNTPVARVPHDNMVINHAAVAREVGGATCAACHQPAYCAQCHAQPVLPDGSPGGPDPPRGPSPGSGVTGDVSRSDGFRWPLLLVESDVIR